MKSIHFFYITVIGLFIHFSAGAQDFIGAGNSAGISVYTSDQLTDPDWLKTASAENTINGAGLDAEIHKASRFLSQASCGYDMSHIQDVMNTGVKQWIEDQMNLPASKLYDIIFNIWQENKDTLLASGYYVDPGNFRPVWTHLNYSWWHINIQNEDLLRHRVAVALSEIFVVSRESDLSGNGDGLAAYYDMLADHAFGNFEELLMSVTLNACMGFYLSHLNNPKADPANNIHPDENYAREIMQLFTIGLYELNMDGSFKKDSNDELIPTYGQEDIRQLAKVFTGLGTGSGVVTPYDTSTALYFGKSIYSSDIAVPMIMYEWQHETDDKILIGGKTIPGGQPGMVDIKQAVHHLFSHPNVAPFISKLLIQRLIKSNPTSQYIERVATVFNNNGLGERGDMRAVIKAIYLDGEARDCDAVNDVNSSKMREPFFRYTQFSRAIDKVAPNGTYYNVAYSFMEATGQDLLASPTVFNFFLPNYTPNGPIADAGLVAPEFQLHNSRSGVGYLNEVNTWTSNPDWASIMYHWEQGYQNNTVKVDHTYIKLLAKDPELFINEMDKVFTCGQMSEKTRNIIRNIFTSIPPSQWYDYTEYRSKIATYIVLISPDYVITR